jgi:hypothetical protein
MIVCSSGVAWVLLGRKRACTRLVDLDGEEPGTQRFEADFFVVAGSPHHRTMRLQLQPFVCTISAFCLLIGSVCSKEITYVTASLKTDGFGAQLLAKMSCLLHAGVSTDMYYVHTPFKVGCKFCLECVYLGPEPDDSNILVLPFFSRKWPT